MKRLALLIVVLLSVFFATAQQRSCGTMQHLEYLNNKDSNLEEKMQTNELKISKWIQDNSTNSNKSSNIITIPVVVHVVWNTNSENISDNQILSQITILNEDFRRLNADASNTPAIFQSVAADTEIEFCLATIDPDGNSTTGITRTQTSQSSFSTNDGVKFNSYGGINAWNTSQYMNIWVCDLGNSLLGYAQFPGGSNSTDGVVCHYSYFGNTGTATYPYNQGRTATHEVGHYLNLRHIWGDSNCGNDYCNDTPTQQASNGGCPNFPSTSNCSANGANGDMYMNYMDYTYDGCMNMFTQDQKTRMLAAINTSRSGLLNNSVCSGNVDVYGCTDLSANNYNSNATVNDGSCCYDDLLTISITTDDYPDETSWILSDQNGNIVESISPGSLTQANTTYEWEVCIDPSLCYDFIIYDDENDGICCDYSNGSYFIEYLGSTIASGGSFSSSETTSSIGSCIVPVVGCINSNAINYDPLANTNTAFGGILDPNIGTGAYFNGNQHLIFNAYVESKIVSAVVYAQSSNTITFELRDNNSIVMDDTTITIPSGGQRLYFDFDVPVGSNYQLGISGTNSGLYRNNGGVSYPYDISSLINITGSSAGTGGYYYFFYDIEVEAVCTVITNTVLGCTDPLYVEFNSVANTDDGSCATLIVSGCTDPLYVEFNSAANTDDGSCATLIVSGCMDVNACNYDITANNDVGCEYVSCAGCTDPLYVEYDASATIDDNSCATLIVSGCTDPLYVEFNSVANTDDNSCATLIVSGCMDVNACNYDITANNDVGCEYVSCAGCTDPLYVEYDASATIDDNSCATLIVSGCTDPLYVEFNSVANTDDGSCATLIVSGCTDPLYVEFNSAANTDDGSCATLIVSGCTDPLYVEFNSVANTDDGSCATLIVSGCTDPLYVEFNSAANTDDGSCATLIVSGCMDVNACNYDITANNDVGCEYVSCAGCTDPLYVEYDASATIDDNSCATLIVSGCTDYVTGLNTPTVLEDRVIMEWDNMNTSTCTVTKYNVRYRELGSTGPWSQKGAGWLGCSYPAGVQKTDRLQLGLSSGLTYEWKMKVWYCDGGESYWGTTEQFTMQGSCPPLTNLAVETFAGNHERAQFTWDSTGTYEYTRVKLRVDTAGAAWQTVGGFGVYSPTLEANKWGLVEGESYRAQARAICHPIMSAWASDWTPLIYWSQPAAGSRVEGGTAITNLDVYPNPSRDVFNISFTSENLQDLRLRVLNVIGEELISENLQQFIGEYTKQINLEDNAKGVYFLEIETKDVVVNKKLILQ